MGNFFCEAENGYEFEDPDDRAELSSGSASQLHSLREIVRVDSADEDVGELWRFRRGKEEDAKMRCRRKMRGSCLVISFRCGKYVGPL